MRVVFLEPGKEAYVGEVGSSLKEMQEAVGGLIDPISGFSDMDLCIIGNEEAKLAEDWRVCRALRDPEGNIYDILAGKAFVCAFDDENFVGLTDEQIQAVVKQYQYPEHILITSSGFVALPYSEPEADLDEDFEEEFEMEFE